MILDEVEQLGLEDGEDLGLTVVHEPLEFLQAAAASAGALSFQDHVCLALAKSHGWIA